MTVVIIGAGPSGLYLANQLKKAHVKDIKVFDPRAGDYLRPGHINDSVFRRAERGIGKKLRTSTDTAHIKDIERALHKQAELENISIRKCKFLRFAEDKKGIIISDENQEEKFIPCDYVFDCSGSKRVVVHAVNERAKNKQNKPPFQITPVVDEINVKNHLLAYIYMSPMDAAIAARYLPSSSEIGLNGKTPLEFAKSMERLRQFGWREFAFPRCYSMSFGKGKHCFYLEAPDGLPESKKEEWLRTVLECASGKPINFKLLPHNTKPRLTTFPVEPQQLNRFCYQEKRFPCVITQGDTQIDPNYYLAHGIVESFERIDTMISGLTISDGKIQYFDEQDYEIDVNHALTRHREALIDHYKERKDFFVQWLHDSEGYYKKAIAATLSNLEEGIFNERLKEIKARIDYHDACDILAHRISKGKVTTNSFDLAQLILDLVKARDLLLKASVDLPVEYKRERDGAQLSLAQLPGYFKDLGNQLYQKNQFDLALQAYQHALSGYQLSASSSPEVISLYSNMILTHNKLNQDEEVIALACKAFDANQDIPENLRKKILFHAIGASVKVIEGLQKASSTDKLQAHILQLSELCSLHKGFIQLHLKDSLQNIERINSFIDKKVLQNSAKHMFSNGNFVLALKYFKKALLSSYEDNNRDKKSELILQSNIVLTHRKLNEVEEALSVAQEALVADVPFSLETKKKILFNTLKAIAEKIGSQKGEYRKLARMAISFYLEHQSLFSKQLLSELKNELKHEFAIIKSTLGESESLREDGKKYFSVGQYELALASYDDSLLMLRFSDIDKRSEEEGSLVANIVLIYRKLNRISEALSLTDQFLTNELELSVEVKKKILFNVIKGAVEAIKQKQVSSAELKADKLVREINNFCALHSNFIKTELAKNLKIELQFLDSLETDSQLFLSQKNY